jgi:hypothetical protein
MGRLSPMLSFWHYYYPFYTEYNKLYYRSLLVVTMTYPVKQKTNPIGKKMALRKCFCIKESTIPSSGFSGLYFTSTLFSLSL